MRPDHRYRLPDRIKERQAAELRRRFARYSGDARRARLWRLAGMAAACILLAVVYLHR